MIVVCCVIVCVNLLYSFDCVETALPAKIKSKLNNNRLTVYNKQKYMIRKFSPYWKTEYNEQLSRKQNRCKTIVVQIVKLAKSFKRRMPCKLLQIIPSPVTKAYRNTDLFQTKLSVNGHSQTMGITIRSDGFSVRQTTISTIKDSHKRVAKVYEDFITSSSLLANRKLNVHGHWRQLLVRSNEAGDIIASVIVQPNDYFYKTIEEQQQALKEYFFKLLPNITLFHQQCMFIPCTHDEAPYILLYGKPYLMETLNGYKFKISPDTNFPVNKLAAQVLYDTVIRTAKLEPNTTVLDICSGTGIISIMASKFVKEVIGIDSDSQAVIEARDSAQLNNITNVNFVLGREDITLTSVLNGLDPSSDLVAIVKPEPDRNGLDIIKTIRISAPITRVVYLESCKSNHPSAVQHFIDLCSNKTTYTEPFRLIKIIPVDLFPQTAHVELILLFERSPIRKY